MASTNLRNTIILHSSNFISFPRWTQSRIVVVEATAIQDYQGEDLLSSFRGTFTKRFFQGLRCTALMTMNRWVNDQILKINQYKGVSPLEWTDSVMYRGPTTWPILNEALPLHPSFCASLPHCRVLLNLIKKWRLGPNWLWKVSLERWRIVLWLCLIALMSQL